MAKPHDWSSIENCVCFNLRRITRAVTQSFDAQMRRHHIRVTQTPILGVLQGSGGMAMAELSDWLGLERTSLLRNLRPLERDGLVRSTPGRSGKLQFTITDKGRQVLTKTYPAWRAAQDKILATLGRERWAGILRDLELSAEKLG